MCVFTRSETVYVMEIAESYIGVWSRLRSSAATFFAAQHLAAVADKQPTSFPIIIMIQHNELTAL